MAVRFAQNGIDFFENLVENTKSHNQRAGDGAAKKHYGAQSPDET